MNRFQPFVAAAVVSLWSAGCHNLKPTPPAKQEAEARWSGVRGKVKLQLAEQQFERRLFDDALATANEAISLDPTNAAAYAIAAKARLELGQAASAERVLDAAQQAKAATPELRYLRGVVLELRGELSEAISAYREAREQDRSQVDFLLAEAECMAAAGERRAALELLSSHAHAYDARGAVAVLAARIAELEKDPIEAARWYREALAVLPDSELVAECLGVLLAQSGECIEAVHLLRPLVETTALTPGGGSVRRALAGCYLQWDDPASAHGVLLDYARVSGNDAAAQLMLAQASLALNDVITAAEAVHRLEGISPDQPDVLLARAMLDWKRGRLTDAAATLERVIENNPSEARASCLLGEVLVSLGDPAGAMVAFERALLADPTSSWAATRLSSLHP
jgi:tetratricopeptide (TPR) repeat protein